MSIQRFTPEFKAEAVRQVIERGYSVAEIAARFGVSTHSLYKWVKAVTPDKSEKQASELLEAKSEILRLRAQMRRLEEERDILKNVRSQAIVEISLMAGSLYGVRVWLYFGPPCGAVALWAGSHIGASR